MENEVKKSIWKKWWFWSAIVFAVIIIASAGGNEPNNQPVTQQSSTREQPQKQIEPEEFKAEASKEAKPTEELDKTNTPNTTFTETEPEPASKNICDCSANVYNCSDFSTQAEAQECFKYCGGTDNDIHKLDRDKDSVVCESLK